jgi:hypothetical protein
MSSRTKLMPIVAGRQGRDSNAPFSTVATPRLSGKKAACPKKLITALGIFIALSTVSALAISLYLLIVVTAATTSISTGTASKRRRFYFLN